MRKVGARNSLVSTKASSAPFLALKKKLCDKITNIENAMDLVIAELEEFRLRDKSAFNEWYAWVFSDVLSSIDSIRDELSFFPTEPEVLHCHSEIKRIYRDMVRCLHPDSCSLSMQGQQKEWLELQSLYKRKDLEGLRVFEQKMLLLDRKNRKIEMLEMSELQTLLQSREASLKLLKRELSVSKKSPAWAFLKKANLKTLQLKLKKELDAQESLLLQQRSKERIAASNEESKEESTVQLSLF